MTSFMHPSAIKLTSRSRGGPRRAPANKPFVRICKHNRGDYVRLFIPVAMCESANLRHCDRLDVRILGSGDGSFVLWVERDNGSPFSIHRTDSKGGKAGSGVVRINVKSIEETGIIGRRIVERIAASTPSLGMACTRIIPGAIEFTCDSSAEVV